VAGVSGELVVGLARDLADVLVWSGRLPPISDWLPAARAAAERAAVEALF
jgi:hypothetical protein